ncbi:hypothetical protein [Streptomyces sp. NPDC008092]|uniref:hypothetical protein n=1 Tax=Streptomyces sp. NPDC008092 TaxID=3364808 RepID=UPI0036F0A387
MTDQDPYTLPPKRTQQDIDALVAFIRCRVESLRDTARSNTEEYRVSQALLDITAYILGTAQAVIERGDNPGSQYGSLAVVARRWDRHPDFQPAWSE